MFNQDEFLKELEEFMIEEEAKQLDLDPAADDFGIKNKSQADFFLKLLNEVREDMNEVNTLCDEKIKRETEKINDFRDKRLTGLRSQEQYYIALLKTYAENELKDSKKRSMKLPEGTIGFKKQQPKYEYGESTLEWLTNYRPEFVKKEEKLSIDKTALKKAATVVGDKLLIDGLEVADVVVIEQEDKFTVK